MLTTSRSSRFRRDFKRISAGPYGRDLDRIFVDALTFLLAEEPLPARYKDHALSGDYKDHRDCHLKPDLVLIYRKIDGRTLQLTRLGSHSELFKT